MQTSVLTPVTLYHSKAEEAAPLLSLLPKGSEPVTQLADIPTNRRTVLVTHDQSSAREANQWIEQQPDYRKRQLFLLLPEGESRLDPACAYRHRPTRLKHIIHFLTASHALPELPDSLALTEIETCLIEQLHVAGGPVAHQDLMQKVWGHTTELDTHTLETHLYRLRKKLESTPYSITTADGAYHLTNDG